MKIAFVFHELSLTGAPRLGLQLAEAFASCHDVVLITKMNGPLRDLMSPGLFRDFIDLDVGSDVPLEKRISGALDCLKTVQPDLVYANSIAAGEWIGAASRLGCPSVLHVHEMRQGIIELQKMGIFAGSDIRQADHVLAASEECLRDFQDIFYLPKERVTNFGVCVDIDDIKEKMTEMPPLAVRHDGSPLKRSAGAFGGRQLVVMCGLACPRKGADIFWQAAKDLPEFDFLWVGPWDDDVAAPFNDALELNKRIPLDNLFWTNMVTNPYAAMAGADLFVLTAREDPNPLVVPEAIAMGIPVATFATTGGSHLWTSRFGFSLSGAVNSDRIVKFARRFFSSSTKRPGPDPSFYCQADLKAKASHLKEKIEDLWHTTNPRAEA